MVPYARAENDLQTAGGSELHRKSYLPSTIHCHIFCQLPREGCFSSYASLDSRYAFGFDHQSTSGPQESDWHPHRFLREEHSRHPLPNEPKDQSISQRQLFLRQFHQVQRHVLAMEINHYYDLHRLKKMPGPPLRKYLFLCTLA